MPRERFIGGSSVAFISGGSNKLIFSRGSGQFETAPASVNYGNTACANNTVLVGAGGFQGSGDGGAITLKFAVPIIQFGKNIEDFNVSSNYNLSLFAFDSRGYLIKGKPSKTAGAGARRI